MLVVKKGPNFRKFAGGGRSRGVGFRGARGFGQGSRQNLTPTWATKVYVPLEIEGFRVRGFIRKPNPSNKGHTAPKEAKTNALNPEPYTQIGFRVEGFGFGVWGLGFGVPKLGVPFWGPY